MELTYEEYLKLGNGKEHLKVVLGNLRIANSQLTEILSQITEHKSSLSKLQSDKDGIMREMSYAQHEHMSKISELNNREASLDEREKKFTTKERAANAELSFITKKIDSAKLEYNILKSKLNKDNNDLVAIINAREQELETIKEEINEYTNVASQKSQDIKKLENERIGLTTEIESARRDHSDFKRDSEKEQQEILSRIAAEVERLKVPNQLLDEREESIEKKTKNLSVIEYRLIRQFKQLNPDKLLPIELQPK